MSDSTLDQYTPDPANANDEQETYKAYGVSSAKKRGGETRLRICYENGTISMPAYTYLVDVVCTSHQYISLIFSRFIVELQGRNLTVLLDLLQDEQLRYVQCYRADFFAEPSEDETVITSITRHLMGEGE